MCALTRIYGQVAENRINSRAGPSPTLELGCPYKGDTATGACPKRLGGGQEGQGLGRSALLTQDKRPRPELRLPCIGRPAVFPSPPLPAEPPRVLAVSCSLLLPPSSRRPRHVPLCTHPPGECQRAVGQVPGAGTQARKRCDILRRMSSPQAQVRQNRPLLVLQAQGMCLHLSQRQPHHRTGHEVRLPLSFVSRAAPWMRQRQQTRASLAGLSWRTQTACTGRLQR